MLGLIDTTGRLQGSTWMGRLPLCGIVSCLYVCAVSTVDWEFFVLNILNM